MIHARGSPALALAAVLLQASGAHLDDARRRDDAVFEAVFRQQIEFWLDPSARASRTVICLAIDPGGSARSVSREYVSRFRAEPAVRRGAECETGPGGAVERATLLPAVLVTAGPVDWVGADEAWVTVSYFRSPLQSGVTTYRVVWEDGKWICLGPIFKQAPA